MVAWLVVLGIEACAVVVLLALVRGVHRRGDDALRAFERLGDELSPALLALRADAAEAQARMVELHRRGHGPAPQ